MPKTIFAIAILAALVVTSASQGRASDSDYIALALSAAPASVASGAAVIRLDMDKGTMTTLRPGTNGFTCMAIAPTVPMCADANSMAFMQAMMKHATPPGNAGIAYMLAGDSPGTSNTDPYATKKTADNHWVITGPHIMLFGPAVKTLDLPRTADPDVTKPYIMWAGTPYEHAMIPVAASK